MATTLMVTPETKVTSLVKLATERHGIPVTAAFWLRLPEADYPSIALVIPLADKVGAREGYGRVMAALANDTVAPKSFLQSRLAVFGERESKEALRALRAHWSLVSKIDHYRNVEIEEIPEAADIRGDYLFHFMPDDSPGAWYRMFYHRLDRDGAVPRRDIRSESELLNVLESLQVASSEQDRILKSMRRQEGTKTVVFDIGLDTPFSLKLA